MTVGTVVTDDAASTRISALERELARYRHLLAESQRIAAIGSFQLDYATGALAWSDEMYRLHGTSPTSFAPSAAALPPLIHPDDRPGLAGWLQPPSAGVPTRSELDYTVRLPDGAIRRLRARGDLVAADDGTPTAMVGTVQDVTERERALSANRESEARERQAVAANRAKTEFLAHMSHELRTPLNAVLGLSEALLERVFGEVGDTQASALSTIHDSGRHLLDLINDVLDIARVESGVLSIEAEQVMLRPLIDEATALVAGQLATKQQRLVIELAPALPPVDIDRRRIKQVLLNLLGNASKFSPRGATVSVRAAGRSDPREVEIAVCDDGPGIAPADRVRIFEPFVTLDPSLSRAHGGAGLGLALAKRIIEMHGGQIRVDSAVGRGSTFTIALPASSCYAGESPGGHVAGPSAIAPHAEVAGRTIVLAEDDDATVLGVRSYLERQGYEVRVARDGLAALEAASARDVAVVVLDIQLPGLDGLEVARRLRATSGLRAPILVLTAHAMPGDERRCLDAGASAYLAKPVNLRTLDKTIGRLLEEVR